MPLFNVLKIAYITTRAFFISHLRRREGLELRRNGIKKEVRGRKGRREKKTETETERERERERE